MSLYRKKPVAIEARQFIGTHLEAVMAWCGGTFLAATGPVPVPRGAIATLEGTMIVSLGDWVIQGVRGEFYPCRLDVFEETYEPVPTSDTSEVLDRYRDALETIHTCRHNMELPYRAECPGCIAGRALRDES